MTDFDEVFQLVVAEAEKDGVITDDESSLLKQIKCSVENFNNYISEALDDGFVSLDEMKKLEKLRDCIVIQAREIAESDGYVTEEEHNILIILAKALRAKKF